MADRTKTLGVRVTPEEYKKFDEYVEESNTDTTLVVSSGSSCDR